MISEVLYVNTNCCVQILGKWLPDRKAGSGAQTEARGHGAVPAAHRPVARDHGDTEMARRGCWSGDLPGLPA